MTSLPLVLVVEDEPGLRDVVRVVLEGDGFRVETAADGQQGLERACALHPDLIVLDMGLPRLTGEEVVAALRVQYADPCPPPIVAMSASGAVAQRARRIGAVSFLTKPFDLDDLSAAVRRALASLSPRLSPVDSSARR